MQKNREHTEIGPADQRVTAAWLALAVLFFTALSCAPDANRNERLDAHYQVLVTAPRDYIEMTREEFIAVASRRLEAVDGTLEILRERDVGEDACEAGCRDLEQRLFELKTSEQSRVPDLRAGIVTDLQALERRVMRLAEPYVVDN